MKRLLIIVGVPALALTLLFSAPYLHVLADGWESNFVRDANHYLDVNCKIGCTPQAAPTVAPGGGSAVVPVDANLNPYSVSNPFQIALAAALPAGANVIGSIANTSFGITGSVAVTGTFYQAVQPVSGTVAVSNFPATQAVTGTFFQATQPVSLATLPALATGSNVIGSIANASFGITGSVAVTGTFYQATQPVSIASMPSTPVTGTFWQATQPVSGTFWQATQPVSIAATVNIACSATGCTGGSSTKSASSAATTVIKNAAGRLERLLVTTVGTGIFTCYDNASTASGTVLGVFPASAAVGTVEYVDEPAVNGITCVSATSGPVVTASYY